jgi:sorting nexin-8
MSSSLFGDSPSGSPELRSGAFSTSRSALFEEPPMTRSTTTALFADDDAASDSPWDIPAPRKPLSRADILRTLLPSSEVPEAYVAAFDAVAAEDHYSASHPGRIGPGGLARTLAAAKLSADDQARIMSVISAGGNPDDVELDRNQFNVLLALIGLAQEGEPVSLDGVDERRRSKCSGMAGSQSPGDSDLALLVFPQVSPNPTYTA